MVRRFVAVGALLLAVLGTPRTSEAGLFDFIWEMSGPQMAGAGYGCHFSPPPKIVKKGCRLGGVAGYSALIETEGQRAAKQKVDRLFLALNGAYYFSTGKDSTDPVTGEKVDYKFFHEHMLAVSPALVFQSVKFRELTVYHSAGVSYNFLFGQDFRRFDKFAFTITPIDVAVGRVSAGFTLRLYPNGFTQDEFGFGPRLHYDRESEWVLGFNVGWALPD
jgi:hypothetical protein